MLPDRVKQRLRTLWRNYLKPFAIVAVVLGTLRSAVADWNDVPTGSMKPTILEGDRIFVNKLAYGLRLPFTRWWLARWSQPARGDVVVFYSPADEGRLVKRVVGIPGDTVELRDDRLFVNGRPADYSPLEGDIIAGLPADDRGGRVFARETVDGRSHPVMVTPELPAMRTYGPVRVPSGRFFVMGDNRDMSRDSRWFGFIDAGRIVGRSSAVAISFDPQRYYLPRWSRFFHGLP